MADADDKFLSWEKWEHDQNERFKELHVPFEVATVLNVTIKRGYEIKRTSILNLIDIPNPQIEVQYKGAKGPTNLPTTTKLNSKNPVWEEKLTFVIDEGSNAEEQQEEMLLKFILVVEDWHAQRSRIAEACYNIASLQIGLSVEETISFGQKGHITVEMCKQSRNTPDLRISLSLCDAEMKFRKQRMAKVMKSLQKTLGCDSPKDLFETPTMSVVGSGGGIRAAIGLSSFMETLDEVGLLDSMAYAVGTSGSAWFLLGAYVRQALTGKSRDSYRDWMRASFHTELQRQCVKLTNICKFRREQRIKDKAGQPTSLVEYFGLCVTDQVIGEQYEASKLSDMRDYVETANAPFPIFSTLEANDYEDVWKYHGHCNLSPFECELPHYAVNLDTMLLNSEFHSGILCRKLQEPSIPFICGAAGSIFAKRLNRILGIDEFEQTDLPNFNADSECSGTERNARKSIWQRTMEWLNNMPLILNRDAFIKRTAKVLNFVRGCSSLKRFPNNPFFQELLDGEQDETSLEFPHADDDTLTLLDSGLLCSVPVDAALRPQRRNDILFVSDLSVFDENGIDFKHLGRAVKLAKQGGYKFPPVDIEKMKRDDPRELYILEDEDDPTCPVVFWFITDTTKFKNEAHFQPRNKEALKELKPDERFNDFYVFNSEDYVTSETEYTVLEYERLRELVRYNLISNMDIIKQKILEKIMSKRMVHQDEKSSVII